MTSHDSSDLSPLDASAEPDVDTDDLYEKYDEYLADDYLDSERVRGRSILSEQEQKAERKVLRRGRLTDRERERLAAGREDKIYEPTLPPGADRWSTWGEGELGPEPRPDWLVIADGAVDSRLGVVKTGKEADVHLVERWIPGEFDEEPPLASCLLAEKIYRGNDHRNFHRDAGYLDGRRTRESRLDRAVANRTRFGLKVIAEQWAVAEFAALATLWAAGAPVPYPVQRVGTELLIEFIGDPDGAAAPRLAALRPEPEELADLWGQLHAALGYVARAGYTHGDLSAYNILVHHGRLVLIDLPQIVDLAANPHRGDYLSRDIANVTSWFAARGLPDADRHGAELLAELRYEARLG
ncbi:MAG TPA: RIO1 family regulatory kinase/ATPase [Actinospica sp.]|nr:RIO1 family regulatory kinase/ATPase [Actinospica sp.]